MAMMISASFPPWDVRPYLHVPTVSFYSCRNPTWIKTYRQTVDPRQSDRQTHNERQTDEDGHRNGRLPLRPLLLPWRSSIAGSGVFKKPWTWSFASMQSIIPSSSGGCSNWLPDPVTPPPPHMYLSGAAIRRRRSGVTGREQPTAEPALAAERVSSGRHRTESIDSRFARFARLFWLKF